MATAISQFSLYIKGDYGNLEDLIKYIHIWSQNCFFVIEGLTYIEEGKYVQYRHSFNVQKNNKNKSDLKDVGRIGKFLTFFKSFSLKPWWAPVFLEKLAFDWLLLQLVQYGRLSPGDDLCPPNIRYPGVTTLTTGTSSPDTQEGVSGSVVSSRSDQTPLRV